MYMYVLLVAVFLVLLYKLYGRKGLNFPGPPAWPLLGNLPQLDNETFHLKLMAWGKQYGDVFKINLFGEESLVLSSTALFLECQVTKGAEFAGRPHPYELYILSDNGKGLLLSDPTPLWRSMRKAVHHNIRMFDGGLERVEAVSMKMINTLLEGFAGQKGAAFDTKRQLYLATVNIMASFLVGRSYDEGSEFFTKFISFERAFFEVSGKRLQGAIMDAVPALQRVYSPIQGPVSHCVNTNTKLFNFLKQEARASEEEGYGDSLVSVLRRSVENGEFPDDNFKYLIGEVIIGGTLTTTNTAYSFLNVMIHNPRVQLRLQAEIDDVIGRRQVSLKDRDSMPYVMATLFELLRHTTILPVGVPHRALKDTTLAGRDLPTGTVVYFNHFALNHDEKFFADPYGFSPERFLDDEGRVVPADHPNRRNMNPFGAGPRVCLGEALAKGRLFLLMVALLQRFDVVAGDTLVSCDPRTYAFKTVLVSPEYKARLVDRYE